MKRTQIYLQENQKEELDKLATKKGRTLSDVIREAVDIYIVENTSKVEDTILETSGLWRNREDVNSEEYLDHLRDDINKRLEDQ